MTFKQQKQKKLRKIYKINKYKKYMCNITQITNDSKQLLISSLQTNKEIKFDIIIRRHKINYIKFLTEKIHYPKDLSNIINDYLIDYIFNCKITPDDSRIIFRHHIFEMFDGNIKICDLCYYLNCDYLVSRTSELRCYLNNNKYIVYSRMFKRGCQTINNIIKKIIEECA